MTIKHGDEGRKDPKKEAFLDKMRHTTERRERREAEERAEEQARGADSAAENQPRPWVNNKRRIT